MTNSELERIAILVEECAEVQQVAMKIIRHGYRSYNPFDKSKTLNRELLNKEIGDLLLAIQLMTDAKDIDNESISHHRVSKREKIKKYLHFNDII